MLLTLCFVLRRYRRHGRRQKAVGAADTQCRFVSAGAKFHLATSFVNLRRRVFQVKWPGGVGATTPRTKKDADSGGGTSVHKNATGPKRANVPTRDGGSMAWDLVIPRLSTP